MTTKDEAIEYLKTKTFVPHQMGNYARYGLNLLQSKSVIQYNNDYWMICWFVHDSTDAVYINKDGKEFILKDYKIDGIIRMQEADN
jgi:hypothetical protein